MLGHSLGGIVAMICATRYPDHPSRLVLSSTSTQPTVGERSFAVFDRLGGPGARAAAMAFWTAPNESSLAYYEALCMPLYTRATPPQGFYARAVRNPAMRLAFFETAGQAGEYCPRGSRRLLRSAGSVFFPLARFYKGLKLPAIAPWLRFALAAHNLDAAWRCYIGIRVCYRTERIG